MADFSGSVTRIKRRIANSEMAMRGELSKIKEQIAVLAEAIAAIEARLDEALPQQVQIENQPQPDDENTGLGLGLQTNAWREWEEVCEPGTRGWEIWGSDVTDFL